MIQIPEEVKNLFKKDGVLKNFRVHFPDEEFRDLVNADIEEESVVFTESLCSQAELIFGLCESPVLQFSAHDCPNIKGATIEAQIEIDCSSLGDEWCEANATRSDDVPYPYYAVPYGTFVVDSCRRSAGRVNKRDISAYVPIAQDNWNLPRSLYNAMTAPWYKAETRTFYIEDMLAASFPNLIKEEDWVHQKATSNDYKMTVAIQGETIRDTITIRVGQVNVQTPTLANVTPGNTDKHAIINISEYKFPSDYAQKVKEALSRIIQHCPNIPEERYNKISHALTHYTVNDNSMTYYQWAKYEATRDTVDRPIYLQNNEPAEDMNGRNIPISYEYEYTKKFRKQSLYVNPRREYISYSGPTAQELYTELPTLNIKIPYNIMILKGGSLVDSFNLMESKDITDAIDIKYALCKRTGMNLSFDNKEAAVKRYQRTVTTYDSTHSIITGETKSNINRNVYGPLIEDIDIINQNYRALIEGMIGIHGYLGKFTRYGGLDYIKLDQTQGLYPSEKLYPQNELYPQDPQEMADASLYETAWYDDSPTKPYGKVVCTFTDAEGTEKTVSYDIINNMIWIDEDTGEEFAISEDYITYDLSDNYFITAYSWDDESVKSLIKLFGDNISDVQYMPAEVTMQGLPYIEAGDYLEVLTWDGGFQTLVLRQTISGIQNIRTTILSD